MRTLCVILILSTHCVKLAGAQPIDGAGFDNLTAARSEGRPNHKVSLTRIPRIISQAFDFPINLEPHPVIGRYGTSNAEVQFLIRQKESFPQVMERYVKAADNLITYTVIHDQICLLPRKNAPNELISNLDVEITLRVENATLWETVKVIVKEVNRENKTPYPLFVSPAEFGDFRGPRMVAEELTSLREISLALQNVTVREALCAAFQASSLEASYRYVPGNRIDELAIVAYSNTYPRGSTSPFVRLSPEQERWWSEQAKQIKASFQEEAKPNPEKGEDYSCSGP